MIDVLDFPFYINNIRITLLYYITLEIYELMKRCIYKNTVELRFNLLEVGAILSLSPRWWTDDGDSDEVFQDSHCRADWSRWGIMTEQWKRSSSQFSF